MNRHNCTNTMPGATLSSALPLSWQGWLSDGKNLMVREFARPVTLLQVWNQRLCSRRQLAELDAHLLRDIGLNTAEAIREADKPFWLE